MLRVNGRARARPSPGPPLKNTVSSNRTCPAPRPSSALTAGARAVHRRAGFLLLASMVACAAFDPCDHPEGRSNGRAPALYSSVGVLLALVSSFSKKKKMEVKRNEFQIEIPNATVMVLETAI